MRNAELKDQLEELQTLWKTHEDVLRTAHKEQREREHNIVANLLNSQIETLQSALAEKNKENDFLHREVAGLKDAKRNLENMVCHNKDHIRKLTDALAKQKEKYVASLRCPLEIEKMKNAFKERFMELSRKWTIERDLWN